MKKTATADVVIFGGGIAGLWLLHRVRKAGFSAILFESGALGGGQTCRAQGIIHGGMKYALQGVLTKEVTSLSDMPALWRACLDGKGEVDLTQVPVLSPKHYLWTPNKFTSKLTGMLASATLSSKVNTLTKENYPTVFQHPAFKGEVFALDEIVIDVPAVVRELTKTNQDAVYRIEPFCGEGIGLNEQGKMVSATVYMAGTALEVSAQHFVFTAGAGNEVIINKLKQKALAMQRRPLHMVLVKTPFDLPLYAHCLGLGPRPRVTITTHHKQNGEAIWYVGGQVAEEGVNRDTTSQINATREELSALFPWLDLTKATFKTFMIDRAEPKQSSGLKPETGYTKMVANMSIAWPTKLALAPKLASDILEDMLRAGLTRAPFDTRELRAWPMPPVQSPIWETAFCKNDV